MNKLSYVNTKHYKNLVFLLLQYHLIITILTFEFPNWYIMPISSSYSSFICNKYQKIGSCRFKNYILLYLASVTNASVVYLEVIIRCAIFWFKWSQGLEVSENRTFKTSLRHILTIRMKVQQNVIFTGEVVLVISLPL